MSVHLLDLIVSLLVQPFGLSVCLSIQQSLYHLPALVYLYLSVTRSVCLFGISLLFKYLHVLNKFIAKSLICQRSYLCCRLAGPLFILACVCSWSPWYVSCLSNHIFDSDILWNSLLAVQQTRRMFIEGLKICCSTGQEGDQPTDQPSDWPLTERWQLLLLQIFDLFCWVVDGPAGVSCHWQWQ